MAGAFKTPQSLATPSSEKPARYDLAVVIVTGSVTVRPEQLAEALTLSLAHVRRSRREPGCRSHAVHQGVEDPNRLFFFEQWADAASLAMHFRVPESGAFVAALRRMAGSPPELSVYTAEAVST